MKKKREDDEQEEFNEETGNEQTTENEGNNTFVWTAWNQQARDFVEVDTSKPFLSSSDLDISQYTKLPKISSVFNIFRLPLKNAIYECKCEANAGVLANEKYGIEVKYYFKEVTKLTEEEQFNESGKNYTYFYDGNSSLDKCVKVVQELVKKVNKALSTCEEFNLYVLDYRTKLVDLVETLSKQYAAQLLLLSEAKSIITKIEREELVKKVLDNRHKDKSSTKKKEKEKNSNKKSSVKKKKSK